MKIEVNVDKRYTFLIVGTLLFVAGIFVVYAYNTAGTGGNPAVIGHSVDEIDWSKPIPSNIAVSGTVSTTGLCLNGDCRTSWSGQVAGFSGDWKYASSDGPGSLYYQYAVSPCLNACSNYGSVPGYDSSTGYSCLGSEGWYGDTVLLTGGKSTYYCSDSKNPAHQPPGDGSNALMQCYCVKV